MPEIEKHLHQLSHLIRDQDSIKLVVRLESAVGSRIRYLAVVSCIEQESEEFCLLGIDCEHDISLGLVIAILSYTTIRLDGDGGFCVTTGDGLRSHIFKPVSVQTMWSALQSLYRASECAKENNSFQASAVKYYEDLFISHKSDPNCLNEWNILPGVENRRPLTSAFTTEELSFQEKISCTLREILLCERDLDEVTSKEIRTKLECRLQIDLSNYKSFIDEEMLKILGQMEAPALILDHLYLGTEWNASHQQDLFDKEINYILNVTTEIDNFFPDTFRYMNIPVCDTEETDILRYFNDSYRFINKARKDGKNVLVHCKMGISRSATIVIAYVMKTRNWDLSKTLKHVKERRNCVKPNPQFMKQLEIYEGILTAKRFSTTLEKRSKSESNLKQSDKSILLATCNSDRVMCSSNSDITDGDVKTRKKYFNTAPARLKPEKNCNSSSLSSSSSGGKSSLLGDILLKPKSSSCTAIEISSNRQAQQLNELLPQDVISSFQEAVNVLEHSPQTSTEIFFSPQETFRRKSTISMEIPAVTITVEEDSDTEVVTASLEPIFAITPILPEIMPTIVIDGDEIPVCCDVPSSPSPPLALALAHQHESSSGIEPLSFSSIGGDVSLPLYLPEEIDLSSTTPSTEDCKKAMSLKCCRRPYNGHTFSVSPNQVVNITSVVDYSKFSVRHLVNEFESQSNRFNQSLSSCGESTNNTIASIDSSSAPMSTAIMSTTMLVGGNAGASRGRKLKDQQQQFLETDYNNSNENDETIHETILELKPLLSSSNTNNNKAPKKLEKLGCLPFFLKKYSSSGSKNSQNKNAVGPSGHVKKRGSGGSRGKILETVAKLSSNEDSISPLESSSPGGNKYQSTGVVKQRREVFENIGVVTLPHQYSKHHQIFFRSHNRSHSASGASGGGSSSGGSNVGLGGATADSFQFDGTTIRKSSMPHLVGNRNNEDEFGDGPYSSSSQSYKIQVGGLGVGSTSSDRKASLDSNGIFKSFPCPMVRGFQNKGQNSRSTHPLNLLPRTPTLT